MVNETVLEFVIAPVEPFINCTCGIETKFVPVIFIVVAVAGGIVCETFATVGLVSAAVIQDNWSVSYTHLTLPTNREV